MLLTTLNPQSENPCHANRLLLQAGAQRHADESWLLACRLAVRVEDASGLCAGESELSLTVSREVQLESVTLAFSEGEIQDAINETLPYPQALATQSATLDPTQTLKVSCHSAHK